MISSNTKGPSLANQSESLPLCMDVDVDMSIVESTILSGRDTTFLISVNYDCQPSRASSNLELTLFCSFHYKKNKKNKNDNKHLTKIYQKKGNYRSGIVQIDST